MNEAGKWTIGAKIFDTDAQPGDQIDFYDKDLCDIVSYQFLGYEDEQYLGWFKMWLDSFGDSHDEPVDTFEVIKGETLYFTPSDGESGMTVSGEVEDVNGSVTLSFPEAVMYNFVNPYPIATTFADVETFVVPGDQFDVYDEALADIVSYQYIGEDGLPWMKMWLDSFGDSHDDYPQSSDVLFPAGRGGFFTPCDSEGREWTVSLSK